VNLLTPNLTRLPNARLVVSSLFDSKEPELLTQDLLLVELPGSTYIDVSWFPEHDPSGAYVVTVFRGHDQLGEAETSSPFEAIRLVERMADPFCRAFGNVSCSVGKSTDFSKAA
jgi:hypothetical protein